MSAMPRPLILAIVDPGLRSILGAYLTMAGETPISTTDHLDPTLGATLRDRAILVIEEMLIASPPLEWAETLRDQCWTGLLIVIVRDLPEPVQEAHGIALVDRRHAPVAIPTLIQRWRREPRA